MYSTGSTSPAWTLLQPRHPQANSKPPYKNPSYLKLYRAQCPPLGCIMLLFLTRAFFKQANLSMWPSWIMPPMLSREIRCPREEYHASTQLRSSNHWVSYLQCANPSRIISHVQNYHRPEAEHALCTPNLMKDPQTWCKHFWSNRKLTPLLGGC
jgi:hypothetical protein